MKKIILGTRFVSFVMILALIIHWKAPVLSFQLAFQQPAMFHEWMGTFVYLILSSVLFVILNLTAAFGLFFMKKWAFSVSYLTIIFSTFTGVSYIPLTYQLFYKYFLSQPSIIPMLIINTTFLLYVIYLDISYRKIKSRG